MKAILNTIIVLLIFACKGNNAATHLQEQSSDKKEIADHALPKDTVKTEINVTGGYSRISGRDTILLQLDQSGSMIIGRLRFDNYQYDGSSGTLKGIIQDDIVKLFYDFESEGKHSISQIYLKYSPEGLYRGEGELIVRGDTSLFKDPVAVHFKETELFKKEDCAFINSRF